MPFALAVALWLGGCGAGNDTVQVPEVDDPGFKLAKQLQRQGRHPEALTGFLKVIETRGVRAAPESHLEAGTIYLHHIKDPIEAIHHFRKYLELQPNSREAPSVRELVVTAKREFARTLPAPHLENQSVRLAATVEAEQLRRENEELRAEIATLRGGGAALISRPSRIVPLPEPVAAREPPPAVPVDSPISAAPFRQEIVDTPAPPARPAPRPQMAAPAGGRTHVVGQGEGLWAIARRYYGSAANGAKVNAIYEANRDQMKSETDLRVGMTLRIP